MKRLQIFTVLFFILIITDSFWAQEIKFARTEDVIYGRKDGMALTMDVFQPEKPNGIGVILLISGGWNSNHDKIDSEWLERIKKLLSLNETVFAVVHSSMPKYKIPDIQKDIARAVRFVRYHSNIWDVDPLRIGIVGHSSGGHLSLLHASTASDGDANSNDYIENVSAKVQAVACFYPPTNFLAFGAQGINVLANPRFQKFLPAFISNINDTMGVTKIADEVSPIKYITNLTPPTLIISGNADQLVPLQQSQIFIEKLNEKNIQCLLEIREGKDHGWPEIAEDYKVVADWFEKYMQNNLSK